MHVWHVEDHVPDSRLSKIFAHLEHVVWAHALRTEVYAAQGSALYLLVVSPHVLAVAPQNLQLVPDRPRSPVGEEVASVGILRHQPQGLLLAHASDHDGRMRPAQCRWVVHGFLEAVVLAAIRLDLPRPHLVSDLQGFFQSLEALRGGWERHTQAPGLAFVPSCADAEVGPSAREHVESGYGL